MSKTPETPRLGGIIPVLLVITALAMPAAVAAVPVFINSGDPAFPFPQFLPYAHPNGDTLHNLATKSPAGVTHAEMEKTIRDAYQIMMNRAGYATIRGVSAVGGVRYIRFESDPYCSEGDGYAMLAAAMMADKTTFDGLWLHTHDLRMNRVVRYGDGSSAPAYDYSVLPGVYEGAGENSAADGDFDIALALMIAHMQWGDSLKIKDSRGNQISYKADFIKVLKGLTDTLSFRQSDGATLITGDVGLDGYFKGGDTWGELTEWASDMRNLAGMGWTKPPYKNVEKPQHIDYTAPSYFRQFADFLRREDESRYKWNISQFERAEASSDWLIGKHIQQNDKNIPIAGWVEIKNDNTPAFSSYMQGEDFRAAWRTVLSYVWHGNPKNSWDPVRHIVIRDSINTFERDAGLRFSRFLWDRGQTPWNQSCDVMITGEAQGGSWWGPSMLRDAYTPQGAVWRNFTLNWVPGTGSPSAVAARNDSLMAELYRQCELEWNVEEPGDRYLTSKPEYFHGFFRLLGMNVLTGNHQAPLNMKRSANMKVYVDVDKTYAFENDTITYTIDYRNYGAEDARGVVITNPLHNDMVYVSSTGGSYGRNMIRWDIGAVSGFKTSTGVNPTKGTVSFKVIIPNAKQKRYENKAVISCINGSGWMSNEYPNKISSVMKRTGVDIAKRALQVRHSVFRDTVNPGMNATYTIEVENSTEAGWLNGGRPGVNFSYGHKGTASSDGSHTFMIRAFNDAHEAYIDYGNYRISYYLFDNAYQTLSPNGWNVETVDLYVPESEKPKFKPYIEPSTPGEDSTTGRKWNQRLIFQIADVLDPSRTDTNWNTMAAPTQFLINYHGLDQRVHRGISTPFKGVWRVQANNYATRSWGGDWSYNPQTVVETGDDKVVNWGYPISPDFTENYDPDYKGKPVKSLHRKLCTAPPGDTVGNILIEEWDGYTWRRVFGNGPLPGRDVKNIIIWDTLQSGVTFQNFIEPFPFGAAKISGRVITWEIPQLLIGEGGKIQYVVTADKPPSNADVRITSRAWASADRESPVYAPAVLVVTYDSLPPPPPAPTTLYKTANKQTYLPGDTINYTIAYKQTHGYPVKSASRDEWAGSNVRINNRGDTITFSNVTDMYHKLSYGTNGTLSGTAISARDQEFHIFARSDVSGNSRVDMEFKWEWNGIHVTIASSGRQPVVIPSPFGHNDGVFDYKIVFRRDSLFLWIGDTSAPFPSFVQASILEQAGYAGVRFTKEFDGGNKLVNWGSHFDLAYNVVIRDTIPYGVRYINGSAAGQINTGKYAPRPLTGALSNNEITWTKIDTLGANDSLTVTWKGVVDTAKNRTIINTAYTDLSGYPKDSVGAQLRSRFALDSADIVEPPDTADSTGILTTGLTVQANPAGGIFTKRMTVTLSSSVSGADIYYTTNGTTPDWASSSTILYDGQPVLLDAAFAASDTAVTLKVMAEAEGYEPSEVITHFYEPLRTVPVQSAFFFDNVGDGKAHGIKLVLPVNRSQQPDAAVIRQHSDLMELSKGLPAIDSLRVAGDTVTVFLRGAGIDPPADARLSIREPELPGSRYTSAHGYLAERSLAIVDGVAPVIKEAVYYPSISESGGISGDTLAVTFNKYAALTQTAGDIAPFELSRAGVRYELRLEYAGNDGNTIYFAVFSATEVPAQGDSIRIAAGGGVTNVYSFPQDNPNNRAVALKVRYPELEYVVKTGPSPFSDTLHVWISIAPHLPAAFEALDPKVWIYDGTGQIVAATGKNLKIAVDGDRYALAWDGCNQKGRKAATGTYMLHIAVKDQDGKRRVIRRLVYLYRD